MLRNKEFRCFIGVVSLTSVLAIVIACAINQVAGVLMILVAGIYMIMFWVFNKVRYARIAKLSEQIAKVLHNEEHLTINEYEEGELSILQTEISKMVLCIREQNVALQKDKEHLADSLADVAHQLRTPLTSAQLILSLLENTSDEKERKALIRECEELFVQIEWLLTALLKLSRLDAGVVVFKEETIEVNQLIQMAVRPFLIAMELHEIELEIDIPKNVMIQGDLGWLIEAIGNIIKNCIESTGDKGKIEISCEDNVLFTEIVIHDSGKGFEQEDLHSLFERFYRGKNSSTAGYGIGLALSKTIITRQKGTIKAKNHSQGGAMFNIRFPK